MDNQKLELYIEHLVPERDELLFEMEQYAKENGVPIMELVGIEAMLQLLRIQNPKKILEVGTAIGYSALRMAYAVPSAKIITIERDETRLNKALEFIGRSTKQEQIVIMNGDALELEEQIKPHGPFDVIFIDAAKGQYRRFFDMYSKYLENGGLIITDNVLFKGLVAEAMIDSRNLRALVRKIREYNSWLMQHPDYHTVIIPVGDGIAISKKRGEQG